MDRVIFCLGLIAPLTEIVAPDARVPNSVDKARLLYGEKCDSSGRFCNTLQYLECSEKKICECHKEYTYNETSKHCVPDIGSYCYHGLSSGSWCPAHSNCKQNNMYAGIQFPADLIQSLRSHRELTSPKYTCQCDKGFATTGNLTCAPVQHGAKCELKDKNQVCNTRAGLICSPTTKTCSCNAEFSYDIGLSKCVKPIGTKCAFTEQCVENGACSRFISTLASILFPTEYESWKYSFGTKEKDVCQCIPGYSPTNNGKCLSSYNMRCSKTQQCNHDAFLECINGYCRCAQGANAHFYMGQAKCLLEPKAACANRTTPLCIADCECKKGHCELKDPVAWDKQLDSLLTHGKNCTPGIYNYCNPFAGLACIKEESCACFDSTLSWNSKHKRCVAKDGEKCGRFNLADGNIYIVYHPLAPLQHRNKFPSRDAPLYVDCEDGLTCVYDSKEYASQCKKLK